MGGTPQVRVKLAMKEPKLRRPAAIQIRRGVFQSVHDLITAIEAYLKTNNDNPQPFVWTATADEILAKVRRGRVTLNQLDSQN